MKRLTTLLTLLLLQLAASISTAKPVQPTPEEVLAMVKQHKGERWYGIYMKGSKIGWQLEKWVVEPSRICVESEFLLEMSFLGKKSSLRSDETTCFDATTPFAMNFHEGTTTADGRETHIVSSVREDKIDITVVTDAAKRTETHPRDINRLEYLVPWAGLSRMQPGDHADSFIFDEMTGRKRWQKVTLQKTESLMLMGRKQTVHQILLVDEMGMRVDGYLSESGIMLQGGMGASLRFVTENKETALSRDAGLVDLYESSVVKATGKPVNYAAVQRIRELRIRLTGNDRIQLAETPRQAVKTVKENQVEVTISACPIPSTDDEPSKRHLECNLDMPCDDAKIRAQVLEILKISKAKDTLSRARAISQWVHKSFKYQLGSNATTADQILKDKTGDCSEFSKAGVMLARSAGIPARQVSGIVLASGSPASFAYHAWMEVWIPERGWVALDPTWGLFPVDASHIVFDVDEGLLMAMHLGDLELEILEFSYAEEGKMTCD